MGEELLAQGDIEEGVEHLSNAVAVCGQPQQLLQVLQQTLPPQVFRLLLERLPVVGQVLFSYNCKEIKHFKVKFRKSKG
jgi:import receptor subunit TOM20